MRQIYAVIAILLPILILAAVSIRSISALQTHPNGDPTPPEPHANPNGGGDEGPPTPNISPLGDGGDPGPPDPT